MMSKHNLQKDEELLYGLVKVWGNDILIHPTSSLGRSKFVDYIKQFDSLLRSSFLAKYCKLQDRVFSVSDEKNRLESIISLFSDVNNKQKEVNDDYYHVMGSYFVSDNQIEELNKLDEYKERLEIINKYLDNSVIIDRLNESLVFSNSLMGKMIKEFELKIKSNISLEQKLKNIIYLNLGGNDLSLDDYEMLKDIASVSKELLDNSLKNNILVSNSSLNEEKGDYFEVLTKLLIFDVYSLISKDNNDTQVLFDERIKIINFISEYKSSLDKYNIDYDALKYDETVDFINEQMVFLDEQITLNEKMDDLKLEIVGLKDKLNEVEKANNDERILNVINSITGNKEDDMVINNVNMFSFDTVTGNDSNVTIDEKVENIPNNLEEDNRLVVNNDINIVNDVPEANNLFNMEIKDPAFDDNGLHDFKEDIPSSNTIENNLNLPTEVVENNNLTDNKIENVASNEIVVNNSVSLEVKDDSLNDNVLNLPKVIRIINPKFLVDYQRTNNILKDISKMFGINAKMSTPLSILSSSDTDELFDMIGGNI